MRNQAAQVIEPTKDIELIKKVLGVMLETIKAFGTDGTPSGIMYSTLSEFGITANHYQKLEETLLNTGYVRKINNVLYHRDSVPVGW